MAKTGVGLARPFLSGSPAGGSLDDWSWLTGGWDWPEAAGFADWGLVAGDWSAPIADPTVGVPAFEEGASGLSGFGRFLGPFAGIGMGAYKLSQGNEIGGALSIGTSLASLFLPPPFNVVVPFIGSALGGVLGKEKSKAQRAGDEAYDFVAASRTALNALSLVETQQEFDQLMRNLFMPGTFKGIGTWSSETGVVAHVEGTMKGKVEPARAQLDQTIRATASLLARAAAGDAQVQDFLRRRRSEAVAKAKALALQNYQLNEANQGYFSPTDLPPFDLLGVKVETGLPPLRSYQDFPGYSPGP